MNELKNGAQGKNVTQQSLNAVFTVPNILSFVRIIIITPFVVAFLNGNYITATAIIAVSGISDCFDGLIARKLNQVTELGKVLDPIADKLTLLAVVVCISIMSPEVIPLMAVLLAKDLLMLIGGTRVIKAGCVPPPARWYGKLATLLFYLSVFTIVFLKAVYSYENPVLNITLLSVTTVAMLFALIKYFLMYRELINKIKERKKETI